MKKFVVTSFGLLLAIVAASPNCWAVLVKFDGGPTGLGTAFLTAENWDPDGVPSLGVDRYAINDDFVVTYDNVGATTSVLGLRIGTDAPIVGGDTGTAGTLNMSNDAKLIVTGGGDSFEIGRACCAGTGVVNMTGDAVLEIQGSDPLIGDRDQGTLNIGDTASVISTRVGGAYWRIGNYGLSEGLQGDGLLNVYDDGSFSAHVIFLGVTDGDGEVRVSGNGSVTLTDNLVLNVNTDLPDRSALVHMIGSSASLSALNLESANGLLQVHNQFEFTADPVSGVSPITLTNAVNITNNDLTVNLNGFPWAVGDPDLLLFDAAPGQIYGTFASSVVIGSVVPHIVIYDNQTGDISVRRVPEPSTMLLLGLGMVMVIGAKRRAAR